MITQQGIWANLKDRANSNIFDLVGSGVPTDGTTGAGIAGLGSSYTDLATGIKYFNFGTLANPVWTVNNALTLPTIKTGTISAANITATTAGAFGHADGVELVAAPGANKAVIPLLVVLSYVRAVATYGAGGDTKVTYTGASGTALTGVVSAANFAGAASSKPVVLFPLTTVAIPLTANAPLQLVTATAFTNPGTAAGVIYWKVIYVVQNLITAA